MKSNSAKEIKDSIPFKLQCWNKDNTYTVDNINDLIDTYLINQKIVSTRGKKENIKYYNVACSFDTETTSFYNLNNEKQATMYVWSACLNGACLWGRTWEEFEKCCTIISERLELTEKKRIIFYVHNLGFDFSFFSKRFKWSKVFALSMREPVQCVSTLGIEFRCSYILSGYSLETLGKQLHNYKVNKLVGDLDYSILRNSKTFINDKEFGYIINDVLVVASYIQEKIEQDGDITKIPLTKTGYVRNATRKMCLPPKDYNQYKSYFKFIHSLKLTPEMYLMLKRVYQGGFVHANANIVGDELHDVASFDFTSSYPTVLVSEKYPVETFVRVLDYSIDDLKFYLKNRACMFNIEFKNLRPKRWQDNPLSFSKCYVENYQINNGRIVSAELLRTSINEIDFETITEFYNFDSFKISDLWIARKSYLPHSFLDAVLTYYEKKTKLKGLEGYEKEYLDGKENLNALYGMCVTDIVRSEILFNEKGEWGRT